MTKQELIDAAEAIEKDWIAHSAWTAYRHEDQTICRCIFGEILELKGSEVELESGGSLSGGCAIIASELGLKREIVRRVITAYDQLSRDLTPMEQELNRSIQDSQTAKKHFTQAVNSIWEETDDD